MRIAFLGTPQIAADCLAALARAGHEIACVYSQPQKPRGRGQVVRPSPVEALAIELALPIRLPLSMRDTEEVVAFRALDLDAAIVVAFGQILPSEVLEAPRLGSFNLHASLLPRWRGASPILRAIMAVDTMTEVQVMCITEDLDEGPIVASATLRIDAAETAGSLFERAAEAGAALLVETLAKIEAGAARETPQAHEGVTYARKIRSAEARIDWSRPAAEVDRQIRGLSPSPGAWFEAHGAKGPVRIKALISRAEDGSGAPGIVLDDHLLIACGEGAVRLIKAQREGKAAQGSAEFVRGFPLAPGTRVS